MKRRPAFGALRLGGCVLLVATTAAACAAPTPRQVTSVPTEGYTIPVAAPATFVPSGDIVRNLQGGEIPRKAPAAPVGVDGLGEVSPG